MAMGQIKALIKHIRKVCEYLKMQTDLHLTEEIPKIQELIAKFEENPDLDQAAALVNYVHGLGAWHEFETRFNTNVLNTHITSDRKAPTLKSLIRDLDAEVIKLHQTA